MLCQTTLFWASFFILQSFADSAYPCSPRDFGKGGTVCVCNTTYCDTIEPPNPVPHGQFIVYSSSMTGLRMKKTIGNFSVVKKEKRASSGTVAYIINVNRTYQTIFGFGTAFTDAAGINFVNLDQGGQTNLFRSYFSPDGIELNFGRVPIGGTDFSTHPYTYDDIEDNHNTISNFNLTQEDFTYKIPMLQLAQAMSHRQIKLFAATWSPPVWMKTNEEIAGFGFLLDKYYQLWADYHIKFLDEYKKYGLKFWGISTGNEPVNGIIPIKGINALGWNPYSQRTWIARHMGPTLRSSAHNTTKLLALDDQRFLLPWWIQILFADDEVKKYIDGIAVHWYWDTVYPASTLDSTHLKYPDKFILGTEACVGDKPWEIEKVILGSWSRGEMYISDIIQDLNHWVTGWVDWNYALDMQGGPTWIDNFVDSPVIVNAKEKEFYKQPMFYGLGHFSKFITEGSKRVHLKRLRSSRVQLEIVAVMRPDGAVVVVAFNGKNVDVSLTLMDSRRGNIKLKVQRRSVHTILYW